MRRDLGQNVGRGARRDARKRRSRSHVCFSVKNAVQNACVCLQGLMGTSSCALATMTGRLRGEDQNALDLLYKINAFKFFYIMDLLIFCTLMFVIWFIYFL